MRPTTGLIAFLTILACTCPATAARLDGDEPIELKVYDVHRLIAPPTPIHIPDFIRADEEAHRLFEEEPRPDVFSGSTTEDLITLIQSVVGRQSDWLAFGGEMASVHEFNGNLIVKAPASWQAELSTFLYRLSDRIDDDFVAEVTIMHMSRMAMRTQALRSVDPSRQHADAILDHEETVAELVEDGGSIVSEFRFQLGGGRYTQAWIDGGPENDGTGVFIMAAARTSDRDSVFADLRVAIAPGDGQVRGWRSPSLGFVGLQPAVVKMSGPASTEGKPGASYVTVFRLTRLQSDQADVIRGGP
ncbi:MAG: hypothetical protein AAGB29_11455 [Planctomycetota bacterium]